MDFKMFVLIEKVCYSYVFTVNCRIECQYVHKIYLFLPWSLSLILSSFMYFFYVTYLPTSLHHGLYMF